MPTSMRLSPEVVKYRKDAEAYLRRAPPLHTPFANDCQRAAYYTTLARLTAIVGDVDTPAALTKYAAVNPEGATKRLVQMIVEVGHQQSLVRNASAHEDPECFLDLTSLIRYCEILENVHKEVKMHTATSDVHYAPNAAAATSDL